MNFGISNPRVYWHNKKPVPSVSTITRIAKNGIPFDWPARKTAELIKWCGLNPDFDLDDICEEAVGAAARYMDECMALGTAVHDTIKRFFETGDKLPIPIENPETALIYEDIYTKILDNVWKWIEKFHVEPILVEKAMSCDVYAGTIDLLCTIDSDAFMTKKWCTARGLDYPQPNKRVCVLLDWKVSAGYSDDMPVKLAAYMALLYDYGYEPEYMFIGRFSKETGSLNLKDYTDEFDDCLETFKLLAGLFHHNFKNYLNDLEQEAERQRKAKIERKEKSGS